MNSPHKRTPMRRPDVIWDQPEHFIEQTLELSVSWGRKHSHDIERQPKCTNLAKPYGCVEEHGLIVDFWWCLPRRRSLQKKSRKVMTKNIHHKYVYLIQWYTDHRMFNLMFFNSGYTFLYKCHWMTGVVFSWMLRLFMPSSFSLKQRKRACLIDALRSQGYIFNPRYFI